MVLNKTIGKIDAYYERLHADKAEKIKASHVEKVLDKLYAKKKSLLADLKDTKKDSKKKRLVGKLGVIKEQIERGKHLLDEIDR